MRSIPTSHGANMSPALNVSVIRQRHLAFALLLAVCDIVFWTPLRTIAALSWSDDRYSHLLLIPMISAFLLYFERARIFSQPTDRHGAAFSLLLGAATV